MTNQRNHYRLLRDPQWWPVADELTNAETAIAQHEANERAKRGGYPTKLS